MADRKANQFKIPFLMYLRKKLNTTTKYRLISTALYSNNYIVTTTAACKHHIHSSFHSFLPAALLGCCMRTRRWCVTGYYVTAAEQKPPFLHSCDRFRHTDCTIHSQGEESEGGERQRGGGVRKESKAEVK